MPGLPPCGSRAPYSTPLEGAALLEAVTGALTALHERWFHRRPGSVRTALVEDELLTCVMRNVYSDVEQTLIEVGSTRLVREARSSFHEAMAGTLVAEVEHLSGRSVAWLASDSHVGPDLEVELFLLGPAIRPGARGPARRRPAASGW
jgi:uncharacterized protein YbcI